MDEFNFKSQVCTDRIQSERLLSLGLKPETADCHWANFALFEDYEVFVIHAGNPDDEDDIPAWSLHRLIELTYGNWDSEIVPIYLGNSYDMLIERIEFQVKRGKFNKKYLCES